MHMHSHVAWDNSLCFKKTLLFLLHWMVTLVLKWANVLKIYNSTQYYNRCFLVFLSFKHCNLHSMVWILKHVFSICINSNCYHFLAKILPPKTHNPFPKVIDYFWWNTCGILELRLYMLKGPIIKALLFLQYRVWAGITGCKYYTNFHVKLTFPLWSWWYKMIQL